jgi:hypothetical protein
VTTGCRLSVIRLRLDAPLSAITVVNGQLTVNTAGFQWMGTQELVLDLTVPEPASYLC